MPTFNRDTDQQEEFAYALKEKATDLESKTDMLGGMLSSMIGGPVFEDDATTCEAIQKILSVVEDLREPARQARESAMRIQEQAEGGKQAQAKLSEILS